MGRKTVATRGRGRSNVGTNSAEEKKASKQEEQWTDTDTNSTSDEEYQVDKSASDINSHSDEDVDVQKTDAETIYRSDDDAEVEKPTDVKKQKKVDLKDPNVFMENDGTEGGRVKMQRHVLKTQKERCNSVSPNVNCRVETLGSIISNLGSLEMRWVKEMGFGGLLFLKGKRLPRSLCYWLMTKVDPIRRMLNISAWCQFPLHKSQVHWVFGLPSGPKKVPRVIHNERMQRVVDDVYVKYGVTSQQRENKYVPISKVIQRLERRCVSEDEEQEFKVAFLILALGGFLCPTSCTRLATDLFPALSVAMEAENYDWCGLVLEKLMDNGRIFAEKFYRDEYAKGCGGCTYFLAIFYLDRLKRQPVHWGVFPRVKAWKNGDVNAVKLADRMHKHDGGDFGECGCLDVAYGERHPLVARDSMGPSSFADEVAKAILNAMGLESQEVKKKGKGHTCITYDELSDVSDDDNDDDEGRGPLLKKRRRGPSDNSNHFRRKAAKQKDKGKEKVVTDETDGANNRRMPDHVMEPSEQARKFSWSKGDGCSMTDKHVDGADEYVTPKNHEEEGHDDVEQEEVEEQAEREDVEQEEVEEEAEHHDAEAEDEPHSKVNQEEGVPASQSSKTNAKTVMKSREKRGTKPSATLPTEDFLVDPMPRQHPQTKAKLIKFVTTVGALTKDAEKSNLDYLPKDRDVVLLKSGDMFANVMNCYSVVTPHCGGVDDNYVRVAAALYTKMWKKKYGAQSIRYMMDPLYSMRVVQQKGRVTEWSDCIRLSKSLAKPFAEVPAARFNVIFVPVLLRQHWWCLAVSVNTEHVWIIDSAALRTGARNRQITEKLCKGVDLFLKAVDESWVTGKVAKWPWNQVKMEPQTDGDSCGVRMLLAIKSCADRYNYCFNLRSPIEEERGWLLNDDVMNDDNDVKAEVKQLLEKSDL